MPDQEKKETVLGTCPTCESPQPHLHPAIQWEGEVELCRDAWHGYTERGLTVIRDAHQNSLPTEQAAPSRDTFDGSERVLRDGEPCSHKGCLNHLSHPCEGCGRIGGRAVVPEQAAPSVSLEEMWDAITKAYPDAEFCGDNGGGSRVWSAKLSDETGCGTLGVTATRLSHNRYREECIQDAYAKLPKPEPAQATPRPMPIDEDSAKFAHWLETVAKKLREGTIEV